MLVSAQHGLLNLTVLRKAGRTKREAKTYAETRTRRSLLNAAIKSTRLCLSLSWVSCDPSQAGSWGFLLIEEGGGGRDRRFMDGKSGKQHLSSNWEDEMTNGLPGSFAC